MKKILIPAILFVLVVFWGCEKNHEPVIQNINCSPNERKAGTIFSLTVTAIDEDRDILQYQWTSDGGEFTEGTSSSQTKWKSPADGSGKNFNIEVSVSDGKSVDNSSYQINLDRNNTPTISSMTSTPQTGAGGDAFSLKVIASDPDDDPLTYKWTCTDGEFPDGDDQATVNWKSPVSNIDKKYNLKVEVSDGLNIVDKTLEISVTKSLFGTLTGNGYYSDCTIPISGVTISVAGKTTTTGSDGKFNLADVPAGTYTLEATKTDYDSFFKEIIVAKSETTTVNIVMTSQRFTSKVYGTVRDQDGISISGAIVLILNPDGSESGLRTTTSATGYYQLPTVPQGERTIITKKTGYQLFQSDIFVVNTDYEFDIQIKENSMDCVDPDGRSYDIIQIGNQVWMAENLAYLPSVSSGNTGSNSEKHYYVYDYNNTSVSEAKSTSSYTKYGVLYNWEAAKTDCPPGWHLPSDAEWTILTDYLINNGYGYGGSGDDIGKSMASTSGWTSYSYAGAVGNNQSTNNSSGFNALPGGRRAYDGSFSYLGRSAYFWSSSENGSSKAWGRYLYYTNDDVHWHYNYRRLGFSVRCLKN